jgi:hypothetical protein
MGFRKPDLNLAQQVIRKSLGEINSSYNDGYVQRSCKQELYQLKCWLDDEYRRLPVFADEDAWEQERVIQILKQP